MANGTTRSQKLCASRWRRPLSWSLNTGHQIQMVRHVAKATATRMISPRTRASRDGMRNASDMTKAVARIVSVLWPSAAHRFFGSAKTPRGSCVAMNAIVSRLRAGLATAGLPRGRIIGNAFGCYQFTPPGETWVDVEAALAGVDAAEGAIAIGNPQAAYGPSLIATIILRRPFLPGQDGPWVDERRALLEASLIRALDCRVEALAANHEMVLAVAHAREAVRLEPYRESGYRRLMRLLAANGDRADAVRAYQQCRDLLDKELGVSPSAETESLYDEITRRARKT